MGIDDKLVEDIVRRVLSVTRPDKIILFGSAATEGMTPDSDIDLLIVQRQLDDHRQAYRRVREALWDIDYPLDILFMTTDWFEQSKDVPGGLAHPANKEGTVIYDAA